MAMKTTAPFFRFINTFLLIAGMAIGAFASAATVTPDVLVGDLATRILEAAKADKAIQSGDPRTVAALVNTTVIPHMNMRRITASAVGRSWRDATPEQQRQLQAEFTALLVKTYASALALANDQKIVVKPSRASATEDKLALFRTEIRGRGEPIQLDYRLENEGEQWRIYDVAILGVWLTEIYRGNFSREIDAGGIDGLIAKLAEKNRPAATK